MTVHSLPGVQALPLFSVQPNPDQPRKLFDVNKLEDLAASIRENGLMQPIKVRPLPGAEDAWQIVAGERRWRAHCLLADRGHLPGCTIQAIVEEMDDAQMAVEAVIENLQRADITPVEEARAFQRLLDTGLTEEQLARKLGIQQTWRIRDRVRLLRLAPDHLKLMETGNLSAEAAYEISRLEKEADQRRVIQMIGRGQLSGYKAVRAAVLAILDGVAQTDLLGGKGKASQGDIDTLARMEAKVESVARMVNAGWKDGECIVARKVAPDRSRLMADKLRAIRQHCLHMENQLREAAAQGSLAIGE